MMSSLSPASREWPGRRHGDCEGDGKRRDFMGESTRKWEHAQQEADSERDCGNDFMGD